MSDLPIGLVIGMALGYAIGLQAGRRKGPMTKEEKEEHKIMMRFTIVGLILLVIGGAIAFFMEPDGWPTITLLVAMTLVYMLAAFVYVKFWRKKRKKK
jgi:protein-S-isoprenylcysteine O-methyltransferase Ste14